VSIPRPLPESDSGPEASATYQLQGVSMRYGDATVLRDISLTLQLGEAVAIVGPNGAGKSTLLHILAGLQADFTGSCAMLGRDVRRWKRQDLARQVGMIPQSLVMEFPFTVEQVVAMGRNPHVSGMFETEADWQAIDDAMRLADCTALRHRDFRSLSGGERQRVILASALAQQPGILLLDEPTTWLDLRHQVEIHRVLATLSQQGMLVVMVTHDLNLASAFANRILMLADGALVADGNPCNIFTPERIQSVFGVQSQILHDASGVPWMIYGR